MNTTKQSFSQLLSRTIAAVSSNKEKSQDPTHPDPILTVETPSTQKL